MKISPGGRGATSVDAGRPHLDRRRDAEKALSRATRWPSRSSRPSNLASTRRRPAGRPRKFLTAVGPAQPTPRRFGAPADGSRPGWRVLSFGKAIVSRATVPSRRRDGDPSAGDPRPRRSPPITRADLHGLFIV